MILPKKSASQKNKAILLQNFGLKKYSGHFPKKNNWNSSSNSTKTKNISKTFKMNRSEHKPEEITLITMARAPHRSNFSIDALLPDLQRSPTERSPVPSTTSDADDLSDGDVNVDLEYESNNEGKLASFSLIYWIIYSSE